LVFSSIIDNITVSEANVDEKILKNYIHHSAIVVTFTPDPQSNIVTQDKQYYLDFINADYVKIYDQLLLVDWRFLTYNDNLNTIADKKKIGNASILFFIEICLKCNVQYF
jgi:hypothetical protein